MDFSRPFHGLLSLAASDPSDKSLGYYRIVRFADVTHATQQGPNTVVQRRKQKSDELSDILFRLKRGLAGYVSYLAACEMNQAFSEYVLYEPILRILTARGYDVECEVPCAGLLKNDGKGDFKRIDFVAKNHSVQFAIEVKWAKKKTLDVKKDFDKLCWFQKCNNASPSFLCVFGKMSDLENIQLKPGSFSERGKAI